MVYLRIISQLVEFILCIFYDAVILTVVPECAEAIAFHLRTVMAAYVSVEKQIQSLKSVIAYALLIVVIIGITLIRCGIRVEPFWLCQEKTTLCGKCQRKECEREIRKGLSQSEHNWLHGFCRGLFPPSKLKSFNNTVIQWKRRPRMLNSPPSPRSLH